MFFDKDWWWWKQEDMVQNDPVLGAQSVCGILHEDGAMVGMARVNVRRCCICSSLHPLNGENTYLTTWIFLHGPSVV